MLWRALFLSQAQKRTPGLDMPPFPGPKGEEIFNNVSKEAWAEWMAHQTTLINEMRLNMMDLTARHYSLNSVKSSLKAKMSIRLKDTSHLAE